MPEVRATTPVSANPPTNEVTMRNGTMTQPATRLLAILSFMSSFLLADKRQAMGVSVTLKRYPTPATQRQSAHLLGRCVG